MRNVRFTGLGPFGAILFSAVISALVGASTAAAESENPSSTRFFLRQRGISIDIRNEEWLPQKAGKIALFDRPAEIVFANPLNGAKFALYVLDERMTPVIWIDRFRQAHDGNGWRSGERRADYGSENYARTTFVHEAAGDTVNGQVIAVQLYPKLAMKIVLLGIWNPRDHDAMCARLEAIARSLALIPGTYETKKDSSW